MGLLGLRGEGNGEEERYLPCEETGDERGVQTEVLPAYGELQAHHTLWKMGHCRGRSLAVGVDFVATGVRT